MGANFTQQQLDNIHETSLSIGDAYTSAYHVFGPESEITKTLFELMREVRRELPQQVGDGSRYKSYEFYLATRSPRSHKIDTSGRGLHD